MADSSAGTGESPINNVALNAVVSRFDTYEEYLQSYISPTDMYYLDDVSVARRIVELGYRGSGAVSRREDFDAYKAALEQSRRERGQMTRHRLVAAVVGGQQGQGQQQQQGEEEGNPYRHSPLLQALAEREASVVTGRLATVLFLRTVNQQGHEVSGYIDFGHRLRTEDLAPVFGGRCRLLPRSGDLSYYNWQTRSAASCDSTYFQVLPDLEAGGGLLLHHKLDRRAMTVDPIAYHHHHADEEEDDAGNGGGDGGNRRHRGGRERRGRQQGGGAIGPPQRLRTHGGMGGGGGGGASTHRSLLSSDDGTMATGGGGGASGGGSGGVPVALGDSVRVEVHDPAYLQAVLYDHVLEMTK